MPTAMGIPVSFRREVDPVSELVSDLLNYPMGLPEPEVVDVPVSEAVDVSASELKNGVESDYPQVKTPSENIRLAVELLLGAEVDSPAYQANLEIAKGYISKEIAGL